MRWWVMLLVWALAVACAPAASQAGVRGAPPPAVPEAAGFSGCPVTGPPDPPFVPPPPWPPTPPGAPDEFWYGHNGLWTALPVSGSWSQLALGEKFWWWSADFPGGREEPVPDLVVTARRLDGEAPEFRSERATNGYHPSFHWAMLVFVKLPSPGCWEFSARYRDHGLRFVVRVP